MQRFRLQSFFREMKRDTLESQHRKMVVYRRGEREKEPAVSAFENPKLKRRKENEKKKQRRKKQHTHTKRERETEVSFRLVSEREENIRRHNI